MRFLPSICRFVLFQLTKERDHWEVEYGKQLLARTKLETLCREFQKTNRSIKVSWLMMIFLNSRLVGKLGSLHLITAHLLIFDTGGS